MSAIWEKFTAFWAAYGPWIGVALIPTIITGLSLSPKLAKDAPIVQKVWDTFKQIMGFLSVATPKDAVGTFQLPMKLGKLKKKDVIPPATMLAMAFGITAAWHGLNACSILSSKPIADIVDCTKQDQSAIEGGLAGLLPLLTGGSVDWGTIESRAEALGATIGGCVLSDIVQQYMTRKTATQAEVDGNWLAKDALEHFRSKMVKGATFHTKKYGDL